MDNVVFMRINPYFIVTLAGGSKVAVPSAMVIVCTGEKSILLPSCSTTPVVSRSLSKLYRTGSIFRG